MISSIIELVVIILGFIITNIVNSKITTYKIESLEKKVDKHNTVIERVYKLEGKVTELENIRFKNIV